jgi:hypothetical protein
MHTDISYKNEPAPRHKAIEDIKDWFGPEKFEELQGMMKHVTDVKQFRFYCGLGGVEGFPVMAWYDSFHGEGAWDKAWSELEAKKGDPKNLLDEQE